MADIKFKTFLKKYLGEYSILCGFTISIILWIFKPNDTVSISSAFLFILAFFLLTGAISIIFDKYSLLKQVTDFEKKEKDVYKIKKIFKNKNNNNSVIILTEEMHGSFKGMAISLYLDENDLEQFIYWGVITDIQSNNLTQILIPEISMDDANFLSDNNNIWVKLKIKTAFPYYIMGNLIQTNNELASNNSRLILAILNHNQENNANNLQYQDPETSSG